MTRISKYALDKNLEKEIFSIFWSSLSQLRTANDTSAFFSDLLSDTEEMMLAKRFTIALLLKRGRKPIEIARILHVSFSMIRSVNEWINKASPSMNAVILSAEKSQEFEKFFDTLESFFDQFKPRYGTDWHAAGKEKWERKMERNARNQLR